MMVLWFYTIIGSGCCLLWFSPPLFLPSNTDYCLSTSDGAALWLCGSVVVVFLLSVSTSCSE